MWPPLATTPRQRSPRSCASPSSAAAASAARVGVARVAARVVGLRARDRLDDARCPPARRAQRGPTVARPRSRSRASWRWLSAVFELEHDEHELAPPARRAGGSAASRRRRRHECDAVGLERGDRRGGRAEVVVARAVHDERRTAPARTRSGSSDGATTSAGASP
jgi:hypothetical protein